MQSNISLDHTTLPNKMDSLRKLCKYESQNDNVKNSRSNNMEEKFLGTLYYSRGANYLYDFIQGKRNKM